MTCPTCRAAWRQAPECPRCGSDLAPLMRLAAAAWRHRQAAAAALAASRWSDALALADEAKRLQRTASSDDLAFLAGLLVR